MNKKVIIAIVIILAVALVIGLCFLIKPIKKEEEKSSIDIKRERAITLLKEKAAMQVFFKQETEEEQIEAFCEEVSKIEGVTEVTRYTKEDAYKELKEKFKGKEETIEEYSADVLPESIIVKIKDYTQNEYVEEQIKKINEKEDNCIDEMANNYYYLEKDEKMINNYSEEELDKYIEMYE